MAADAWAGGALAGEGVEEALGRLAVANAVAAVGTALLGQGHPAAARAVADVRAALQVGGGMGGGEGERPLAGEERLLVATACCAVGQMPPAVGCRWQHQDQCATAPWQHGMLVRPCAATAAEPLPAAALQVPVNTRPCWSLQGCASQALAAWQQAVTGGAALAGGVVRTRAHLALWQGCSSHARALLGGRAGQPGQPRGARQR